MDLGWACLQSETRKRPVLRNVASSASLDSRPSTRCHCQAGKMSAAPRQMCLFDLQFRDFVWSSSHHPMPHCRCQKNQWIPIAVSVPLPSVLERTEDGVASVSSPWSTSLLPSRHSSHRVLKVRSWRYSYAYLAGSSSRCCRRWLETTMRNGSTLMIAQKGVARHGRRRAYV